LQHHHRSSRPLARRSSPRGRAHRATPSTARALGANGMPRHTMVWWSTQSTAAKSGIGTRSLARRSLARMSKRCRLANKRSRKGSSRPRLHSQSRAALRTRIVLIRRGLRQGQASTSIESSSTGGVWRFCLLKAEATVARLHTEFFSLIHPQIPGMSSQTMTLVTRQPRRELNSLSFL